MVAKKGEIRKRLANGLMVDQNRVMLAMEDAAGWKEACEAAGVSPQRFREWIRRDAAFREAFERAHSGVVEGVRKQLEASAQKAAEVYDEALDATKDTDIETTCPECGAAIKITAEVPDFTTRLKAGDAVLRVSKILKDVKEVTGQITIQDQPLYLQIAYARFKREGREAIPPNAYEKLVDLGIIKALPAGDTVEGEFHYVEDEHETAADNV